MQPLHPKTFWIATITGVPMLLTLFLAMGSQAAPPPKEPNSGAPAFTEIQATLPAQKIPNAQLLYFDVSAATALGIQVPPGRVGLPEFDRAVLDLLAYEIQDPSESAGPKRFYIEADDFGGAGRSGFLEVSPGVHVSSKGIGRTGLGTTRDMRPGPPQGKYLSHADGAHSLDMAVMEAVMSRVGSRDLKNGGSRVVAIIGTDHPLKFPDGSEMRTGVVVRTPVTRMDLNTSRPAKVVESLARANVLHIRKGDFVNFSNIGAGGEFIDYGGTSYVPGYAPVVSNEGRAPLLREAEYVTERSKVPVDALNERFLGEGLLNQLGIPEEHFKDLAKRPDLRDKIASLGKLFQTLAHFKTPKAIPFHQAPIAPETIQGFVRLEKFIEESAANLLASRSSPDSGRIEAELKRLLALAKNPDDPELRTLAREFVTTIDDLLGEVLKANRISNPGKYAEQIRPIAHFKNREVPALFRPNLFQQTQRAIQQDLAQPGTGVIQQFIDRVAMTNPLTTLPGVDNGVVVRANSEATEVFLRAAKDSQGEARLFAYPESKGVPAEKGLSLQVSTDGGKTTQIRRGEFVSTPEGDYFKITLPHRDTSLSWEPLRVAPFTPDSQGEPQWILGKGKELLGPPLVFNERLGLPADFQRDQGLMWRHFGVRHSLSPETWGDPDQRGARTRRGDPDRLRSLLRQLLTDEPLMRQDALEELMEEWRHYEPMIRKMLEDPASTSAREFKQGLEQFWRQEDVFSKYSLKRFYEHVLKEASPAIRQTLLESVPHGASTPQFRSFLKKNFFQIPGFFTGPSGRKLLESWALSSDEDLTRLAFYALQSPDFLHSSDAIQLFDQIWRTNPQLAEEAGGLSYGAQLLDLWGEHPKTLELLDSMAKLDVPYFREEQARRLAGSCLKNALRKL